MARVARELERKKQERRVLNAKVKTAVSPPIGFISRRRALWSTRHARINCRWNIPSLTNGPHHDRSSHAIARTPSSRRGNRRAVAGGHIRLPTPPTTRAAAAPEKTCPQREATAATAGIKWPCPLPSKEDPRSGPSPWLKLTRPSKGANTDQWTRSPFKVNGRHKCPRFTSTTDQRFGAGTAMDHRNLQMRKTGGLGCYSAQPY
jgi:hypothetical protein